MVPSTVMYTFSYPSFMPLGLAGKYALKPASLNSTQPAGTAAFEVKPVLEPPPLLEPPPPEPALAVSLSLLLPVRK